MTDCPWVALPPRGSPASLCPAPPPLVSVGPTQTPHHPAGAPSTGWGTGPKGWPVRATRDGPERVTVARRPRRGRQVAVPPPLPSSPGGPNPLPKPPTEPWGCCFGVGGHPALQCLGAEVGWPGGSSVPPPSLAAPRTQMAAPWQPARQHLCLRARCPRGAAGNRTLCAGEGGGEPDGEAARGPATGRIWGTPRVEPLPPQQAAGVRWDAGGHCGGLGSTGRGTLRTPGGSWSPGELLAPPSLHRDPG